MTGRVNDTQRSGIKLQFGFVIQIHAVVIIERVRILPHAFVKFAHRRQFLFRHARAYQEL